MSNLRTLKDALVDELKDLHNAERQLIKALPLMEKKASNASLKQAFGSHLVETQGHVDRLEQIAELMRTSLSGKTCKAMQGLIEEGSEVIEEDGNEVVLDALLIGCAQRVEHYEIAAYGVARAMAQELELEEVVGLLTETIEEEGAADKKLSEISESEVLPFANSDEEGDQPDEEEDDMPKKKTAKSSLGTSKEAKKNHAGKAMVFALAFAASLALPHTALAETKQDQIENEHKATQHNADNTGRNARDRNEYRKTADDQAPAGKEVEVLASIRKEILANDQLSVNGQNVKIIVDKGTVTLRGPVKSNAEKDWIQEATSRVASGYKVVNQLEVTAG